jgi:hypothetical protein
MKKHIVFVAQECSNCDRLLQSIYQSPSARQEISVVDISSLRDDMLTKLRVVPTMQTKDGQVLEGGKVFDFVMQNYQDDTELVGVGWDTNWMGSTLECSTFDEQSSSGRVDQVHPWSDFQGDD